MSRPSRKSTATGKGGRLPHPSQPTCSLPCWVLPCWLGVGSRRSKGHTEVSALVFQGRVSPLSAVLWEALLLTEVKGGMPAGVASQLLTYVGARPLHHAACFCFLPLSAPLSRWEGARGESKLSRQTSAYYLFEESLHGW